MEMRRIILLSVLALEGAGGILGGLLLTIAPDGRLMDMPVEMMHGVFADFLIPGIILTGMGLLTLSAFIEVYRRSQIDWLMASLALIGYTVWFTVEILILREIHWLHVVWGTPVLVGLWAGLPLMSKNLNGLFGKDQMLRIS